MGKNPINNVKALIKKLNSLGGSNKRMYDSIKRISIFKDLSRSGLKYKELLTRYLLLKAVLDQGPDMDGIKIFLSKVIKKAYKKKICFLHNPKSFFNNLSKVFKIIDDSHKETKEERAIDWAKEELGGSADKEEIEKKSKKYNLLIGKYFSSQLPSYVLSRWGPPLAVMLILDENKKTLFDLCSSIKGAENLSKFINTDSKYGMGKAIGEKAAHLFVKYLVYSFELVSNQDKKWGQNSYEVPFDSNAGRVLFMSGFFQNFCPKSFNKIDIKNLPKGFSKVDKKKKNSKIHMEITEAFRGKKIEEKFSKKIDENMREFFKEHIKNYNPRKKRNNQRKIKPKIELQHVINYISYLESCKIGAIDDGLMLIGKKYCKNKSEKKCDTCPINKYCTGKKNNRRKTKFET